MKVYIGPFVDWIGPYQIAEKLCFWAKKEKDDYGFLSTPEWVHNFGTWLANDRHGNDSWLTKVCNYIYSKQKRTIKVKIHDYDTWDMDSTLAVIILPLLKQMKERKHGSPFVDDEDVPDDLKSTAAEPKEKEYDVDSNHHKRWDYVVDEMIWAFEQLQPDNDWEEQYRTGEFDMQFEPCELDETGKAKLYTMIKGPKHTYEVDDAGVKIHHDRIVRGTKLFGKYFQSLSD